MADARPARRFLALAAHGGLALLTVLVAGCGQRTAVEAGDPHPAAAATVAPAAARVPTTRADAESLTRALAPRMGAPAGGFKMLPDGRGNLMIKTRDRLQNVTVVGRGSDGQVVSGCVSAADQVPALLGSGGGR